MKKVLMAALLAVSSAAFATGSITDELTKKGISFIAAFDAKPVTLAVFGSVDPKEMCELADTYPDDGVEVVYNMSNNIVANCRVTR